MLNIERTVNVADTTWEKLADDAANGLLKETLHSGDKIRISLSDGEAVTLIIGRDETGKTYFVFDDCLNTAHYMNVRCTNKGAWDKCDMRRYLNAEIFGKLPPELQAVIKPTTIVQVVDGKRVESVDKLFLLSYTQMFGTERTDRYVDFEPEDSQLDIYKTERSRVKERADYGTEWYSLRTPYGGGSNYFCSVNYSGSANSNNANYSNGVAPGFCIE